MGLYLDLHVLLRICHDDNEVCHKDKRYKQNSNLPRKKHLQFSKNGLEKVWILTGQLLVCNI